MQRFISTCTLIATLVMSLVIPINASAATDQALTQRLKGYTLLSVDGRGELYYVQPDTGVAQYLGTYQATWDVIKSEMIGITDADLARVETDSALRERLMGRFLLAVESRGEVYYLRPSDQKLHYLGTGASTFDKLKFLALGINSENLAKLNVELAQPVTAPQPTTPAPTNPTPESPVQMSYSDGQLAMDFVSTFTTGYEAFKQDFSFYPEIQYFEALFEWNQPIYLTETGFSLAPGDTNYFVWEKVDAEFKDFYFNYLSADMTLYSYMFTFMTPTSSMYQGERFSAGEYVYTNQNGLMTLLEYAQLLTEEQIEQVDEETIANAEAARIIEGVRMMQKGLLRYYGDYNSWPMTGEDPIIIGENGSAILSREGHFWGSPDDKAIYIEQIPSGQPSTHFVYHAPIYGQPYSLTFELHGYYETFTPGKYQAIPNDKIRRIGDLD